MVKLENKYRDSFKVISERDWMNKSKKYWAIDGIVQVMVRDNEVNMQQLKIALKYRSLFI